MARICVSCEVCGSWSGHHGYKKKRIVCLVRCVEAYLDITITKKEKYCVL